MFGVSPAFVVSMFGTQFTVDEFCAALKSVKNLGFDGYQPEVFHKTELSNWKNGGAMQVNRTAEDLGLIPTQFVAHFLMENFSTPSALSSDSGIDDFVVTLDIVKQFPQCDTIVVPIGPFHFDGSADVNPIIYTYYRTKLREKIEKFLLAADSRDVKFAVEILPNSIMCGIDGFLSLAQQIGSEKFGISLDTGHAWASGEHVPVLPLTLQNKIFGLHMCDNDSNNNYSLAPGRGTIDWELFMKNLNVTGYGGSIDIEIICKPNELMDEYLSGREYLNKFIGRQHVHN